MKSRTDAQPRRVLAVLAVSLLSIASFGGVGVAAPEDQRAQARSPQLEITKSVTPNPMIVGGEAVYVITVRNSGDTDAEDVVVTDALDPAVAAGEVPAGCSADGRTVTCGGEGTTVAAGESVQYTVPVTVRPDLADGTNIANTATATSSTPGASDARAHVVTPARTRTDVEVTKSGPATVNPDGTITYTITATNHGPSDAVNVTLQDETNGQRTSVVSASSPCNAGGLTVTCPLGTLAAGESETVTIRLRANSNLPPGTVIPNCVQMYTGSTQTTTANDRSCVQTAVVPRPQPIRPLPLPAPPVSVPIRPLPLPAPPVVVPIRPLPVPAPPISVPIRPLPEPVSPVPPVLPVPLPPEQIDPAPEPAAPPPGPTAPSPTHPPKPGPGGVPPAPQPTPVPGHLPVTG